QREQAPRAERQGQRRARRHDYLQHDQARSGQVRRIATHPVHHLNDSRSITSELKEFPEIGLGLFVVAGGLHLAIVQEKAITDRDHKNPNDSPWADDLIRKTAEFAPFAIENRNRILNTRANAISLVKFVEQTTYIPGGGPVDSSYWFWQDTFVGDSHRYPNR